MTVAPTCMQLCAADHIERVTRLTLNPVRGYPDANAETAGEFGDSDYLADGRLQAVFLRPSHGKLNGRAVRGRPSGLPVPSTGSPTCARPRSPRLATEWRVKQTATWSNTMQPSPQSALAQSILDPSTEVVISMPSFGVVQYFGTRPALEDESLFPATHWPASLAESAWLDGNVSCHLSWDRETERWVFSRSITFASVADACAALKAVRRQTACATTKAAIQQAKADTAFQKFKALCAA